MILATPLRPKIAVIHVPPEQFEPSRACTISLKAAKNVTAILHYRHIDQAERWISVPMSRKRAIFTAEIPASYTASPYPLQYYFEFQRENQAWSYPGFNANLTNVPYYAIFKRA